MVPKLSTIPLFASLTLLPSLYIKLAVFPNVSLCLSQIGSGIGRMILKEEMKARSGSYDNDPWGSARNSRSGSKETLNTTGHSTTAYNNTVNGCKDPPSPPHTHSPPLSLVLSVSVSLCTSDCVPVTVQPCLCSSHCDRMCVCRHKGFFMRFNICYHQGFGRGQLSCGCRTGRVMAAAGVEGWKGWGCYYD